MASLTTVYGICIVLASLAGIGSAFAANKIYPLTGGALSTSTELIKMDSTVEQKQEAPEDVSPEHLEEQIAKEFGNEIAAKNIVEFIRTPVENWQSIAPSFNALRQKYARSMTHPDQDKCPKKLTDLCNMVSIKFSEMRQFINGETHQNLGDQSADALKILNSTE